MKILHVIDEPWDSGLTSYALQIAELLQQAGQEVAVGVLPGKVPESLARQRKLKTLPAGNFFQLFKALRHTRWDVVNVHTGRTHTWSILARLLGGRSQSHIAIVRTRGDARPLKVNPIFKFIYNRTAAVIAASDHVRKQYEVGLGLNEEQARTIFPAVPEEPMVTVTQPIVGLLGRLDEIKGHAFFLEAAAYVVKEIPEARFLAAGKEAGISMQLLQNQVRELGLQDHVEFLGYVPSGVDFMNRCSIGVIASIGSEEVSRACLEWMAAGRPVVGTLVGCLPELIEPEETGLLIPPGDAVALKEALLRLIRDPQTARLWGDKARHTAQALYSSEQMLSKTLRLYEWAIAANRTR